MDLREFASAGAERHPWELARADFFCELLARHVLHQPVARVLDIGAGDGFFASRLANLVAPSTEIVCFDPNYSPALVNELAMQAPENVRFSNERPALRADLLLMLDVLEHIEDDQTHLRELVSEALAPEGFVLVSVPAWPSLFGRHDRILAHHRRYTPTQARSLLHDCGLRVLDSGGAFHSLLPIRILQAVWWASTDRKQPPVPSEVRVAATDLTRFRGGARLSRLLLRGLKLDNALSRIAADRRIELPGLSWWALCQRA